MEENKSPWNAWLTRIEVRKKVFEDGWWKAAKKAVDMYDSPGKEGQELNPFHILYANTEVLLPSLYSNSPRPDVAVRGKAGKAIVAEAAEAYLLTFIDMNVPGKETFDDAMERSTLSALVPGMGFVRLRVYPGQTCPVRPEAGTYRELIWGRARKWSQVPWIAFVHLMTKEDIIKQFELSAADQKKLSAPTQEQLDGTKVEHETSPDSPLHVYELWIKDGRKIAFLCAGYKDILLGEEEDALQLASFYPTPGPLALVKKTESLDPTPLYEYYRNQAEELNRVTTRLNRVLDAIRVRGAYNPLLGDDLANLLGENTRENGLVKASAPMDLQGKGFEAHIWFLPIEKLITVARELYTARQHIMSVIQQITGLADIVRGSTVASETATAQELKNKWGTIRLKRMQKIVANYVRDLLRLAVDAASKVLSEEEWAKLTQLPIPTAQQKQMAQAQLQQMAQAAAAQQQPQMPGMPPPQPPDPQLIAQAQSPSWAEVLAVLEDDNGRSYTIDIETNSTVDADASSDKEEVAEFMTALGQMLAGLAPLAQLGPSGMQVSKELLLEVTGKFKFGRQVKESLMRLEAPPPGQGDPKAAAEAKKVEAETANVMAQAEADKQKLQVEQQVAQQEAQLKMRQMQMDEVLAQRKHVLELQKMDLEAEKLMQQRELSGLKLEVARKQAKDAMSAPKPAAKSAKT